MNSKEPLWLAALLHDLGKFGQRAEPEAGVTHQHFGRQFVQSDFAHYFKELNPDLAEAIAGHHDVASAGRTAKLVKIADRLSMKEEETEISATFSPPWEPLSALLTCQPLAPTAAMRRRVRLQPLPLQSGDILPDVLSADSPVDYDKLWKQFKNEFADFAAEKVFVPADMTTILSLLHKYTSNMPAETATYQQNLDAPLDISLYMHLKTTAAIAACLYDNLSDDEIDALLRNDAALSHREFFALVKGDISGTQDFLYLLTSSGAARGLRARSFYLQLLTETIARWILCEAGLTEINLLFAGGGHFYLLLPHGKTDTHIESWRQKISDTLWRAHRGDLYINLGFVPITAADFDENEAGGESRFAQKWSEVTQQIASRKQQKWLELGVANMQNYFFAPKEKGGTKEVCDVCHFEGKIIFDEEKQTGKCERCREFEQLGKELRAPKYMITINGNDKELPDHPTWQDVLAAFGAEIRVAPPEAKISLDLNNATLWTFDSSEFLPTNASAAAQALLDYNWKTPRRLSFRLLAAATPSKFDEKIGEVVVAEFSDLAKASQGAEWLGVLRMDVDNLGEIFRTRLGNKKNIARMSTLSENLRLFFESRVPQFCQERNLYTKGDQQKKDRLFLLYAGGDDLFLVGAWSELPILAKKIRDEFRLFAGGDHITVSAGIAIEHDKYPLYQLANDAKHALDDRAKEYERKVEGRTIEKDAICFLQSTVGWEQFCKLEYWQDELVKMIKAESSLPRGFLTRLGQIHSLFAENRKRKLDDLKKIEEMIYYEKWRWHLVYQLGRIAKRYSEYETKICDLQKQIIDNKLIDNLNVIARWAELLTR